VSHDNGAHLTIHVTVGRGSGPGERTFVITRANGKSRRINYRGLK
jgi:hypothetical protein